MTNIKELYKIEDYTLNILDGLGYEVVLGNGIQNVERLIDKKTKEIIPYQIDSLLDLEACAYFPEACANPVLTNIYKGKNGEEIHLEEFGKTTIYYDNLDICIQKSDYNEIIISIKDKKEGKNLYVKYVRYIDSTCIKVQTDEDKILKIYNETFTLDELTSDNIKSIIIDSIKKYKNSSYFSERIKKGIEVIAPAIDTFTEYLKEESNGQKKHIK